MKKLRIAIVDLVSRSQTRTLYARVMHANLASIMPQVLAVWCEELGHDVRLICYTGFEDLAEVIPSDIDILFVGAFSQDAQKYFDYVLGFTDKATLKTVLDDCQPHSPLGMRMAAAGQPATLPGVR